MTLYSKWSTGKNIMFASGLVMLLCLVLPWFHLGMVGGLSADLVWEALRNWDEFGSIGALLGSGVSGTLEAMRRAYVLSNLRWLALLPMAYGFFTLFLPSHRYSRKNWCCISALVTIGYVLILTILAASYFTAAAWLFLLASLVFFVGAVVDRPAKPAVDLPPLPSPDAASNSPSAAEKPASNTTERDCPGCGRKNPSQAKFCAACGMSLAQDDKKISLLK